MSAGPLRRLAWALQAATLALLAASAVVAAADPAARHLIVDNHVGNLIYALAFTPVGTVLAVRRSDNAVGWLLVAIGVLAAAATAGEAYALHAAVTRHGEGPGVAAAALVSAVGWSGCQALPITFLFLLFPDGRLPSRRWRPLAIAIAFAIGGLTTSALVDQPLVDDAPRVTNPLALPAAFRPVVEGAALASVAVIGVGAIASIASLVLRFRRSRGERRQQLRWLAAAGGLLVLSIGYSLAAAFAGLWPWTPWLIALPAVPVAIGVAVLRYRLYDLDRLISRTVSYAVITGPLLALYAGLVTVATPLLPTNNSVAVAGSTLAVAALFQPLRRRVQSVVDRRFNRARYDAARTVDAFSRRLRAEVDLETVRSDLVGVVSQTLQPAEVSVWLRPMSRA
ncbi:MAG: hypothetical protein NVSMB13_07220 [Mycobacteriales bacterium]